MLKPFDKMWLQRDIKSQTNISTGRQPFNLTEYVYGEVAEGSISGQTRLPKVNGALLRSSNLLYGEAGPTDFDRASTL